jgi:VCBS repeat protein
MTTGSSPPSADATSGPAPPSAPEALTVALAEMVCRLLDEAVLRAGALQPVFPRPLRAALLSAAALIVTVPAAAAGPRIPVGSDPQGIAIADLNGDGRPDLVTANQGSNDVSVLLGAAGGRARRASRQGLGPTPLAPVAVAVGDLNRDGRADVVTANVLSGDVAVLLGQGGGRLRVAASYPVGAAPEALAMADLDGDGRLDLVTANAGSGGDSGDVSVLTGRGDGSFRPARGHPVGRRPWALAVADLNGDRIPDLAVADRGLPGVAVLLGVRGGRWRRGASITLGTLPSGIVARDLDGDGVPDLAVADFRSDVVWLLAGRGRGAGFERPLGIPIGTGPTAPSALAAVDLNRDRVLDLAVADFRGNRVAVLAGAGGGRFLPAVAIAAGPGPSALAAADLTGDGLPDLAVVDSPANAVTLLYGVSGRGGALATPAVPAGPGGGRSR